MPNSMQSNYESLKEIFRGLGSVVVAYSGGVDSALMLKVGTEVLGRRTLGLTADGPALSRRERQMAIDLAEAMGAEHRLVESHEIDDAGYQANAGDRCYFCKGELYSLTTKVQQELGFDHVVNGTNVDDLGDHRPGLTAAEEAGVKSPLVIANMGKQEVRGLAEHLGLKVWDKPASPCLASRIPYGTRVTKERLLQIETLENALRDLGLVRLRVRFHKEVARVEVAKEEMDLAFSLREQIVTAGRRAGFLFVSLDLAGFESGSLNRALPVLR